MRAPVALLAIALGSCAPASQATTDDLVPAGSRYVAMGSSFAAGPGIGPVKPGTPERCTRAANNYASLLAAALSLDLADMTCSGATTDDLLGPDNELPAQLDAVTPDTRLVTITVGGNDLDYMGLLFSASCDADVRECPPRIHPPAEDAFEGLRERMGQIIRRIHSVAPEARVVFVQYLTLVPDSPCESIPLDEVAQAEAHELAARLAAITSAAAREQDALVLPADQLSADHTACDADPWSQGFPPGQAAGGGAPWHPTAAGHAAIANALNELLSG